jgi:hypothetical protein
MKLIITDLKEYSFKNSIIINHLLDNKIVILQEYCNEITIYKKMKL